MNKDNFLKKIIMRLNAGKRAAQSDPTMHIDEGMMGSFFHMLAQTEETELSCDDVFRLLDQYAEMEISGEDAANLLPLVKSHLDNCMDCREEFESLVQIIRAASEIIGCLSS